MKTLTDQEQIIIINVDNELNGISNSEKKFIINLVRTDSEFKRLVDKNINLLITKLVGITKLNREL